MAEIKPVHVKVNGQDTQIPAHYLADGGVTGTYVQARMLIEALGIGKVLGEGNHIEIITKPKPLAGRRIAVSAPHSKNANQSPINSNYYEGNVMFYVAKELKDMLEADGAKVLLIRDDINDVYTLKQRTDEINTWNADLMIEIHSDAYSGSRGIFVIRQIARNEDPLAQLFLDELHYSTGLPIHPRGVWTRSLPGNPRFDYYHMLREILCHGVIIECGDHTNSKDMEFLASPASPKLIAEGARNAIVKYYTK